MVLNGRFKASNAFFRVETLIPVPRVHFTAERLETMSVENEILSKESNVYDEKGRTVIPSKVREAVGIEKGDRVRFIVIDGDVKMMKVDNDDE